MHSALRIIPLLLAAALLGSSGGQRSILAAEPAPPVFCAQPEYDAGDQPAGTVLSHAFTLRNPLGKPVALALTNHAGLTVTGVPASLAAGESATVTLTSEPIGGLGEVSYVADLSAGAAPAVLITLELHGRVLQFFKTEPPEQQLLLTLAPGQTLRRELSLARKDGLPFIVSGVRWEEVRTSPLPAAAAKLRTPGREPAEETLAGKFSFTAEDRGTGAAAGWRGWAAVGPLARRGLYFARLRIATDHPRQPEVVVDVVIRNLPPLVIFPGEIHFFNPVKRTDITAGTAPVRRLFIHALPGEPPFAPGALRIDADFLSARWTHEGTPRADESVLEISLQASAPAGPFTTRLHIARSDTPGDEEIVLVEGVILP